MSVSFTISESPDNLEVSLYFANDTTTVDEVKLTFLMFILMSIMLSNIQNQLVSATQTNARQITFQNLDTCSTYWVTVTALNCGLRIRSEPYLLGLGTNAQVVLCMLPSPNDLNYCT